MASIGLGLTVAIFFISISEGVYLQVVQDGVTMQGGHITLEHPAYRDGPAAALLISGAGNLRQRIEAMDAVERTKLLVIGQGVARAGADPVGVMIMGVEPPGEREVSPLARCMVSGSFLEEGDGDDGKGAVILGTHMAGMLNVEAGGAIDLLTSQASGGGGFKEETCRVKGVFKTGAEEIDGFVIQRRTARL